MPRAGLKDRRIILRAPVKSTSTTGGPETAYPVDTHTVWARKTPASGSQRFQGQRDITIQDLVFEIYYLSDVMDDGTEYQLEFESKKYDIKSVIEVGRRQGLQLVARLSA